VVKAWMASPEHRHIILLPELRFVGFGVVTGSYHDENDVALATADFFVELTRTPARRRPRLAPRRATR
jgi:hypothetical protein